MLPHMDPIAIRPDRIQAGDYVILRREGSEPVDGYVLANADRRWIQLGKETLTFLIRPGSGGADLPWKVPRGVHILDHNPGDRDESWRRPTNLRSNT